MMYLLDRAFETARSLQPNVQDDLARLVLQLAGQEQPVIQLSPDEAQSFDESLAQAERGEFCTDAEVLAIWAKHGL